jgi:hypothetical protein
MKQPVTGFHQDDAHDWVAELSCGHFQHMRHNPPWINHPQIVTVAGRQTLLGTELNCKKCARGEPVDTR